MSDDELGLSLGPSPVILNELKVSFSISAKKILSPGVLVGML